MSFLCLIGPLNQSHGMSTNLIKIKYLIRSDTFDVATQSSDIELIGADQGCYFNQIEGST